MKHVYFLWILLFAFLLVNCENNGKPEVVALKVEMQENPQGIATVTPRFSWQIASKVHDLVQESYRIQVASSKEDLKKEKNLIWDSGIVLSDQSILIPYGGNDLASQQRYFWRVKIATGQGESGWSEIRNWSMAILNEGEWQAKWIGENGFSNPGETDKKETRLAARYLRKPFTTKSEVQRAMLYISGQGSYQAFLNGQKISEEILSPTVSWYPERVYYNVYDVTSLVRKKENLLGVTLGNGRFFGMREGATMVFGFPRLLAQLKIEYRDGSSDIIVTDASWKVTSKGPIVANNEYDGEEYDARLELIGWDKVGYDDNGWKSADLMEAPGGKLTAQPNPNMQVQEEIKPVGITRLSDGKFILDMGQNMVGWLQINLKGKKGQPVTLRFAEVLNPDSTLYLANIRGAKVTDIYTPAQDGMFTWEPSFVFHGFRFVEISGLEEEPPLSAFTGKVIYDKMATTGSFETSNEIINRIFKNAYWGIRGNYRGMPTDCPQRDERHGWLGDRATGCYGEAFIFNNALLYSKWTQDIEDSQSPEGSISVVSPRYWTIYNDDVTWPAAYFYAANMLYRQYGDTQPIKKHYASMKRYLEHIREVSMQDGIITKDTYGDWCMPPESQELIHSADPARKTAGAVLSTTMYYSLLRLMTQFAEISDHPEDIPGFLELAAKIKEAYNAKFFHADSAMYDNNTVTANILSLRLGLVPEGYEQRVFENLSQKTAIDLGGHVSAGVLGIQQLMRGLTENGNVDLAYKIATNDTYPSWGYMVKKGATTIWELWNGDTADPAMNSGNHVMLLGDLIIWYYENLAGIKNHPESVGYKQLLMRPSFPKGLSHVKASYQSVYGEIDSEWKKENGVFSWDITIPANCSAIVQLPKRLNIKQPEGEGIRNVTESDTEIGIEVGSGSYRFTNQ